MNTTAPPAWRVGEELPAQTYEPVTRLQLIKYAGASGDFNPIHTIDQAAAEAGLPGVIQHGMLTMATIGRLFSPYQDRGFVQRFDVRFSGMVGLGDVVTVGGRVSGHETAERVDAYLCEVYARNQDGQDLATGSVTFVAFRD